MNEMIRALAGETFARVMERQAFMFAGPAGSAVDPEGEWREASISFKGPFTGSVRLAAPRRMSLELAAKFLGKDVSDPAVEQGADDSFKELLNVLCGHLLTTLAGEEAVFDLSMPWVNTLPLAQAKALAASGETLVFLVDRHPVFLRVAVDGDWRPADRSGDKRGNG